MTDGTMIHTHGRRLHKVFTTAFAAILTSAVAAAAHADEGGTYKLLTTIPITGLNNFDITWIDSATELGYIADRTNNAIDVIDTRRNVLVKQIQKGGFRGESGDNDTSGPNGITVSGRLLFAGDAPSRLVAIDLRNDKVVGDLNTGGENRADELAFDARDNVVLVINGADDPPFATLVKVDRTGKLTPTARITFDAFGPNGDRATAGVEQVAWDPVVDKFFVTVPEVNGPGGTGTEGAVAVIDPRTAKVEQTFPISQCQPTGITVGSDGDLLVACGVIFDTRGIACDEPTATSALDCHGNSANPKHVIIDKRTGRIEREVFGLGGSDEIWFDPGSQRYFTASRDNPTGPVLGVIDAERRTLRQLVPTFSTPLTAPKPRGSAKSVAADARNSHVFMPLPGGNAFPNCLKGCVAVFGAIGNDD